MTTMRFTYLVCDGPGCVDTYPADPHHSADAIGELSPEWLVKQASLIGWSRRYEGAQGARGRRLHLCKSCSKSTPK